MRKEDLPGACFSGTFRYRKDAEMLVHSGVVVIDIDKVGNSDAEVMARALEKQKGCMSAFISTGGKGVKALFKANCDFNTHRDAFASVVETLDERIREHVDHSGKNESRLCFVSHDPALSISDPEPIKVKVRRNYLPKRIKKAGSSNAAFNVLFKWAQKKFPNIKGHRNNLAHLTACSLNRSGVPENETIDLLKQHMNLPEKEVEKTVKGVYSRNKYEHGTRPFQDRSGGIPLP